MSETADKTETADMTETDELRATVELLARRVRTLEDQVEITQLVAQYGPAVDSGSGEATADLWTEDGVFDAVPQRRMRGREQIAGMVEGAGHQSLIRNGCGHVLTVPHVVVDGDEATGRSYALNIRWDAEADRFWMARGLRRDPLCFGPPPRTDRWCFGRNRQQPPSSRYWLHLNRR